MDGETFYRCWQALDALELEAYKELDRLWKDSKSTDEDIRDQTNMLMGITRSKAMIELVCKIETDRYPREWR